MKLGLVTLFLKVKSLSLVEKQVSKTEQKGNRERAFSG
jgi:hypothetical protein